MGLKLLPGRKLARMAFMVDFSFTWLSVEPSKCPSNTSDNKQTQYIQQTFGTSKLQDRVKCESVYVYMCVCVCVYVCVCVPSGRSCSGKEGPGVIGSAPGSAGDGSMEEEAEGSVLRWRSSVKEKHSQSGLKSYYINKQERIKSGESQLTFLTILYYRWRVTGGGIQGTL